MQGTKQMGQTNTRDAESRAIIRRTARITGYSESYIEKVIKGDRQNELIFKTYMELLEHGDEKENELKMAVKELVPVGNSKVKIQKPKKV